MRRIALTSVFVLVSLGALQVVAHTRTAARPALQSSRAASQTPSQPAPGSEKPPVAEDLMPRPGAPQPVHPVSFDGT